MINQEILNAVVQEIKRHQQISYKNDFNSQNNLLLLNQLMNIRHFHAQFQPIESQNV